MQVLLPLAIALLPALGTIIGGLIAESTKAPKWVVGVALHAAAGIAIAVVSVDLMPRIMDEGAVLAAMFGFATGAAASFLLVWGVRYAQRHSDGGKTNTSVWMVYAAIAADLFGDGLMTGIGSTISSSLGLILGLSQLIGNIPGGFGAVANFKSEGLPRSRRLLLIATFTVPIVSGAGIGFIGLRDATGLTQALALAFVVGILLLATVEDTLPQGDEPNPPRFVSTAAFAGGFIFFAMLASSFS
nr:peptidoglycan-binding protein [Rhizobium sp. Q54]